MRGGTCVAMLRGVGTELVGGRYRIVSLIGRGGMGHVYRAVHVQLGREVALKVLASPSGAARGEFLQRFAREAHAIAKLDHPGCVRVLDYGDGAEPFLAMELLDGPTLATALSDGGRFSIARSVAVARALLLALAHAHDHGVIHRDIKPENVMFTSGNRTVLIDFGLAALANQPALTAAGMAMGSPSYIAPERLLGRPHGPRGDLYAVGVILYEMLAGVRPFEGGSPREIMQRALDRPARPLRSLRPDLPPALDAVVRRALSKEPMRRFADAEDMLTALDDATREPATDGPGLVAAAHRQDADAASASLTIALLGFRRRFFAVRAAHRVWGWLRYGRWRWRYGT